MLGLIRSLKPISTRAHLVRLGPDSDGGYVVPDDLEGISACISPGVSYEVGFDNAMAEKGIDVYMADASVEAPPISDKKFHFTKKFIDVVNDEKNIRLDDMVASSKPGDLILQMDIEGAEWRVLLDSSKETLERFRIMVIEFHSLQQIFSQFSFGMIDAVFRKILSTHSVVHIHPNNIVRPSVFYEIPIPPMMEFTFYRNDCQFLRDVPVVHPSPLDRNNVPTKAALHLPELWR